MPVKWPLLVGIWGLRQSLYVTLINLKVGIFLPQFLNARILGVCYHTWLSVFTIAVLYPGYSVPWATLKSYIASDGRQFWQCR